MSIKRIFIAMTAIFAVSAVFADNSSVTSKKYVDDLMSGYQGKLPGSGANKLMIYDDETGIGEKSIEATLVSNATGVPTVGAVKTGLDGKQDTITGTAGYVMTGTGNAGEVGAKPIYSANTNYSDALVTAETVNTGVINAVNSSLIRVNEQGAPSDSGTLWKIQDDLVALNVREILPDGYIQLEWIESTGTQYIDTGYTPTVTGYKANIKFMLTGDTLNSQTIVGFNKVISSKRRRMSFGFNATGVPVFGYGDDGGGTTGYINIGTLSLNTMYDNTYNYVAPATVTVNGTQIGSVADVGTRGATATIYVMAVNDGSTTNTPASTGKWYYAKIWDNNDTLVRDFVPARRNSDNVVGMYDTVSGTFFPDAAGGNFIAGPAVAEN